MPKKRAKPKMHPGSFTPAQIAAANRARDNGGSNTPKAVLGAFAPEMITAAGIALQPVTMATILMLQRIDSGLLKKDSNFEVEDILRALVIFTHPIDATRALVARKRADGSMPEFDDAVFDAAKSIPAASMLAIGEALNKALTTAFATMVPHGVGKDSPPDSPFPAAPTPGPDSAGS